MPQTPSGDDEAGVRVGSDGEAGPARFVQSEIFARNFKDGMALVEETANYLDGDGREAAKALSRSGALAYASVSMRLTTQLMQIASWLLVLRAVREGDMRIGEAYQSKYRLPPAARRSEDELAGELPPELAALVEASRHLYDRISRLDAELFAGESARTDDVAAQQKALFDAFARR
ncbi:MAG: DUF1465 family protein [Parvularculaceae bacterium]